MNKAIFTLITLTLVATVGCGDLDSSSVSGSSLDDAFATGKGGTNSAPTTSGSGVIRLRCEVRSNRSKISLDANNVAPGRYSAKVVSQGQVATSGQLATVGDEVEFDFDSERDDIAAGAVAIPSSFIQGATVTGELLDQNGDSLGSVTVSECLVR